MSLAHFLYIPGVLLLGAAVGYVLGTRTVAVKHAQSEHRARAQAARARARAQDTAPKG